MISVKFLRGTVYIQRSVQVVSDEFLQMYPPGQSIFLLRYRTFPMPWKTPYCPLQGTPSSPQAIHSHCSDFYHHIRISSLEIHRHGIIQYRFFCVWLLPLNIMFLRFICIIVHYWLVTFYCWILFCCMSIPQFAYPVSCSWTFGLLPGFSYYEKSYEHSWTNLFLGMFLFFLGK